RTPGRRPLPRAVDASPSRRATPRDGSPDRALRASRPRLLLFDRDSRHTHPRARHALDARPTAIAVVREAPLAAPEEMKKDRAATCAPARSATHGCGSA